MIHSQLPSLEIDNTTSFESDYRVSLINTIEAVSHRGPHATLNAQAWVVSDRDHSLSLGLSTSSLYFLRGTCWCKHTNQVDNAHLGDWWNLTQTCEVVAFLIDWLIVRYFLDLSITIKDETEIVLHGCESLISELDCATRAKVNVTFLEDWTELIVCVLEESRLNLTAMAVHELYVHKVAFRASVFPLLTWTFLD